MSYQYSQRKKASDVGQPAKYDELNETLLYSSPHQEHGPAHPGVDGRPGAPAGEPVTDGDGQEMRASRRREWAAETDAAYTVRSGPDEDEHADVESVESGQALGDRLEPGEAGALVGEAAAGAYWQEALLAGRDEDLPSVPGPFDRTADPEAFALATEERIVGEHAERERQREKAHGAAALGIDRATRSRADLAEQAADRRASPERSDPREELTQDELGAVNEQAQALSEKLTGGPPRASLSRRLAIRVRRGADVTSAALDLLEDLYEEPGVFEPISRVDPWQYEADIEGTVTTLFEPMAPSQQQVGYIRDESGESVKVTIWEKSQQGTVLREGDVVRIRGGKPGEYNGQLTLAVTYDTMVTVVEQGDGAAPVHHTCRSEVWDGSTGAAGEQRLHPCESPSPSSDPVPRPRAARCQGTMSWVFPVSACPEWWCEREDVSVVEEASSERVELQPSARGD